jgi:hypothetical protein
MKILSLIKCSLVGVLLSSCTKLDEKMYSLTQRQVIILVKPMQKLYHC